MTLTKADIGDAVYREVGLSKTESNDLVNALLDHISKSLVQGNDVKITNFGTFKLSYKQQRMGRNPKTGDPAIISSRRIVTLKPSPNFQGRVDSGLKRKRS